MRDAVMCVKVVRAVIVVPFVPSYGRIMFFPAGLQDVLRAVTTVAASRDFTTDSLWLNDRSAGSPTSHPSIHLSSLPSSAIM